MAMLDETKKLLLDVLSRAIRGEQEPVTDQLQNQRMELFQLAMEHHVLPLIVDALYDGDEADPTMRGMAGQVRDLVIGQAQRTADFLLLLQHFEEKGLRPVVVKGLVCRSLYPEPELRPSVDEDLLIRPEDFSACDAVMKAAGFSAEKGEQDEDYEIVYRHPESGFYIELHTSLFPEESEAYGDCEHYFDGAIDRAIEPEIGGACVKTLAPTDHMLFLICHAYKHLLHGGVGIRQICDMELMAERFEKDLDWAYIRRCCDELNLSVFTAALLQIGEKHLGFAMPEAFSDLEVDESALLEDILSGGLYGVVDVDRAHSSTMTLEAVSADRDGRKRKGALHSVFLPLESMRGNYPYLRKHPWLLPAAWTQRIIRYLARKDRSDPVNPVRSVQIARERIDLLKQYQIIR